MKDNSAIILGDAKAALVAGLQWQFAAGSDSRSQIREIRRQADELGARSCVRIGRQHHAQTGFYAWDPALSDESRPRRIYSFAALLSHRLHPAHAVVAWRIAQGPCQGQFAIVVTEDHLPIADLVLPLAQARAAVARFRQTPDLQHPDGFWSNDLTEFPDAQPMVLDWADLSPGKHERIRAIPTDPLGIGTALGLLALVVSGLLAITEYSHHQALTTMVNGNPAAQQALAYDKALQAVRPRLGADSAAVNRLLDEWMDHPVILANWSLTDVVCDAGRCTQTWQSEGGYTHALEKAMKDIPGQTTVTDMGNSSRMQVHNDRQLTVSGITGLDELPDSDSLRRLLFEEKQVWTKANVMHRIDLTGTPWPQSPAPAAGQPVLRRHAVSVTAPPQIIRNWLQDYAGLAWWEQMHLHVKPFETRNVLLVELQGAFYAY